jgi:hypothetical protein
MPTLPLFYKGAGPGTHWHVHDARMSGFTAAASALPNRNSTIRHITAYSHPSPLISLSASFAVARQYALTGPAGVASPAAPGYVYEVDFTVAKQRILDPLLEIVRPSLSHLHSGDQGLILALAQGLAVAPCVHAGGSLLAPSIPPELRALVYALRDGEVLAHVIPSACITNRHAVH